MADSPPTSGPPKRPKGRPTGGGETVGRAAIVQAALVQLKTVTPGKLSLRSIARAAGCDPQLVRYYYSDLQGVLVAVAAQISEEMHARVAAALSAGGLARRDRLRALVGIYLDVFLDHPYQHQLFTELVLPRRGPEAAALLDSAIRRVFAEVSEALNTLPEPTGPDPRKIDPVFAYIAIFGMLQFFVNGRDIRRTLRPLPSEAAEAEAYVDFIVSLLAPPDGASSLLTPSGKS